MEVAVLWAFLLLCSSLCCVQGDHEVTWTPRDFRMVLPTCCNYQHQFSEKLGNCTSKPPNNPLTFDDMLNIPPHIISDGYRNRTHLQNIKFSLKKQSPVCPGGTFLVSIDTNPKGDKMVTPYSVSLTPNSHLQVGHDFYSPREYCVDSVEGSRITFAICKPTCDARRPCIPKCCDLGQAWDFSDTQIPHCGEIPVDKAWQPTFYADKYTKLSREGQAELVPHYVLHHPASGFCNYGHPIFIPVNALQDGANGILVRILQDGSIVTRARRRHWINLPLGDYCVDTIKNPFQANYPTIPGDLETLVFYCHKEAQVSEGITSRLYGVSMILSSIFLILTLLVFGLLWENHRGNIQRWTVFCYVAALLLMYTFFVLSYFSPDFDSDSVTNMPICRFVAIGMHFTFLMNFCFLSCINFEIWWTVRSFAKQSTFFRGFTRLYSYIGFAVGLPLSIISIALILDVVYENDLDSEVIIPEYGRFSCSIGSHEAFWAYMYGPVGVLLITNIAFFITTVVTMWRILKAAKSDSSVTIQQKESELLSRFGKLYIIQGVPWIFELISFAAHEEEKWYWILLDLINIFQSVAIFIIFVCNRETIFELCEKYAFCEKLLLPITGLDSGGRKNLQREEEDSKASTVVDLGRPTATKENLELN